MAENFFKIDVPELCNAYMGTETEENLWIAYIGESMARNRYDYYASIAKKAGLEQMAEIFSNIALNEKEHAKLWFKKLGQLQEHEQNLRLAAMNEHMEWTSMYLRMALKAQEEGFEDIADLFTGVAEVERHHEEIFRKLLRIIDADEVFTRSKIVMWECRNCGHIELTGTLGTGLLAQQCPLAREVSLCLETLVLYAL